jgi:hypothetical protein
MAADEAREAEAEAWSEALVGDVADEPRRHGGWATSLSIGDRPSRSVLQPGPGATSPSYSSHSRDSLAGMVQRPGIA